MSSIITEMWAWYALTVFIVLARMASRRLLFKSFKRLQYDDWLMCFTICVHTALLVIVWMLTYTPTNLINPADDIILTPEDIRLRAYGSKLVLVTEHLQMIVIWSVKGCLLLMYSRLTIVAGYVIASYIVMIIAWFCWCRPFHNYWAVPPPDRESTGTQQTRGLRIDNTAVNCAAETNHMITNAVFNISSDVLILLLPMPVFIKSQLPLKRKLILCGVFALGIFTILAAALSKYYSLGSPYGTEWIYWYIREVSTAIITANLPLTWTLLQRIFGLSSFYSSKYGKSSGPRIVEASGVIGNRGRSAYGNLSSRNEGEIRKPADPYQIDISPTSSQEQINGGGIPLKIWQQHEVRITTQDISSRDATSPSGRSSPTGIETVAYAVNSSPPASLKGDNSVKEGYSGFTTQVTHGV